MRIHEWLKVLAERKGSDLYLATGAPHCAKFAGELKTISSDVLLPGEVAEIANELMDDT
jgi:twitching motility protein PilU